MLSESDELALSFKFLDFEPPYYNHSFTALRAIFDRYLAKKAEEAGAVLVTQTVVDEVIASEGGWWESCGARAARPGRTRRSPPRRRVADRAVGGASREFRFLLGDPRG